MIWEGVEAALALILMTSIFWIPALIIGYLWRNRREENSTTRNMRDRLDMALAEQRLNNMEREQALEDKLDSMRRKRLSRQSNQELDEGILEGELAEDIEETMRPKQRLPLSDKSKRLRKI